MIVMNTARMLCLFLCCFWGGSCLADYPVFQPSEGRRFGGEFLSRHTAPVDACIAALESAALQRSGMLSRSEILAVIAEMDELPDSWGLVDFAVKVVQDCDVSSDDFLLLLKSQLGAMEAMSGQTRITTKVGNVGLRGSAKGIPEVSAYTWVIDLKGTSIIDHVEGGDWPWFPLKAIISRAGVEFTMRVADGEPRVVLQTMMALDSYRFPEWHPLVSSRFAPPLDENAAVSLQSLGTSLGRDNLRSGYSLFKAGFFQQTEFFNGVECYVYGSLDQAVFIDKSDLRRVVGEIDGRGWLDKTGNVHLVGAHGATVRLNSDFTDCAGIVVPASTEYRFCNKKGEEIGSAVIKSQFNTQSIPTADFKSFEPYLRVDSQGSMPVGVVASSVDKRQSKWSVVIWLQIACVLAVLVAIWVRKRHA